MKSNFEIEGSFTEGLDSLYQKLKNQHQSDDEIAVKLIDYSKEKKLLQPDQKGGQLIEIYRSIVNKLKRRVLIEDLGTKQSFFEWFSFHVPPSCKGSIEWSREKLVESEFGVKVFGSGLGGSASLKLTNAHAIDECDTCQSFIQHFDVHVRKYGYVNGDIIEKEEYMIEPVKWRHLEIKSEDNCPYCNSSHSEVDEFIYDLINEEGIDLRASNVGITREWNRELVYEQNANIGLKLFKELAEINLNIKKSGTLKAKVKWDLKPGKFFIPYVEIDNKFGLPYWTIS